MILVNLTKKELKIYSAKTKNVVSIYPSGTYARTRRMVHENTIDEADKGRQFELFSASYIIIGLPPQLEGSDIIYIVSRSVMTKSGRKDLVSPGLPIYDEKGNFIAYNGLRAY